MAAVAVAASALTGTIQKNFIASDTSNPNQKIYFSLSSPSYPNNSGNPLLPRPPLFWPWEKEPHDEHWKAVKRILRYLKGTISHGLILKKSSNLNIIGYADADWASNPDDRKSTTGYCIYMGNNPVSWSSRKQATIARSSTEAEYRSLASATAEVMWLQSLLQELKANTTAKPTIWCDNLSAVSLSANPIQHARTKHIEIDLFFVREQVIQGKLLINHVPAYYQKADILTKALSPKNFIRLREELRVKEIYTNPNNDQQQDKACNFADHQTNSTHSPEESSAKDSSSKFLQNKHTDVRIKSNSKQTVSTNYKNKSLNKTISYLTEDKDREDNSACLSSNSENKTIIESRSNY